MADPVKTAVEFHATMMQAWSNSIQIVANYWRHCAEMQQQMLAKAGHHRQKIEIATGPALTDKYGRRSHDIDPERDV